MRTGGRGALGRRRTRQHSSWNVGGVQCSVFGHSVKTRILVCMCDQYCDGNVTGETHGTLMGHSGEDPAMWLPGSANVTLPQLGDAAAATCLCLCRAALRLPLGLLIHQLICFCL